MRARYLLGSRFARDIRTLPGKDYEQVHGSYGIRSYLYAEMVFGNALTVSQLTASMSQVSIHAMRTPRAISLTEIVKRTGLPADEVRRFNPALVDRVPAGASLYLPSLRRRFWSRRDVLAAAGQPRLRRRARRLHAPRARRRAMGRSGLRAGAGRLQTPFQGNEHGGRPGDGDGARVRDGSGVHEQPPHAARGVPEQRGQSGLSSIADCSSGTPPESHPSHHRDRIQQLAIRNAEPFDFQARLPGLPGRDPPVLSAVGVSADLCERRGQPNPSSRSRAMSLVGALPKKRAYSLLNCDALR